MIEYSVATDVELVKELLGYTIKEMAAATGIGTATLNRWIAGSALPSRSHMAQFYDFAFQNGIRLNAIKGQLHKEQIEALGDITLFHGAKTVIEGSLSLEYSKTNNDFGQGFYCGERLEQAAMFVANYPESSLYIVRFDPAGLRRQRYVVDQDWMLTIAYSRGLLEEYRDHPRIKQLRSRLQDADYVVAPIADNRMFEILGTFVDGEITDVQCQHCLSATDLGSQYVFTTQRALDCVILVEHCFLAPTEKRSYLKSRHTELQTRSNKVKTARKMFRNQGAYIEELLS